jgi:gluconate:H+ symporter, GntP family
MHPLWIVLIGVGIVVGGVLILRLHAFLALILAAVAVGALTPQAAIEGHLLAQRAIAAAHDPVTGQIVLDGAVEPAARLLVVRRTDGVWQSVGRVEAMSVAAPPGSSARLVAQPTGDDGYVWQDGDRLVEPAAWQSIRRQAGQTVGERVAFAFGDTCGKIGILIALAAIIGKCLMDSGSADRIVRSAVRVTGERGAPAAFLSSGFVLGIPVFFDTVFYLMMPLGKALHVRTGRDYLLYVLTIIAGATMAHSLVPPTPGPLFVAEQLGVDLGLMILAGTIVGLFSSSAGYLFAWWVNRRFGLPLRESADFSREDMQRMAAMDERQLPPLGLAVLPIVIPLVLIAGQTLLEQPLRNVSPHWQTLAATLGDKNIALAIAAAVALGTLVWQKRTSRQRLAEAVQAALSSGGVIILITAAGGALGSMLQQTGVAGLVSRLPSSSPLLLIVLAFLITAAIRTAQGSATVAMITSVGILSGIVASGQLGCHPVFLALAIGCGSKPVAG